MWYGGKPAEEVNVNRLVSYVDQRDNHVPLLTVEETMKFSLYCMEVSTTQLADCGAPA